MQFNKPEKSYIALTPPADAHIQPRKIFFLLVHWVKIRTLFHSLLVFSAEPFQYKSFFLSSRLKLHEPAYSADAIFRDCFAKIVEEAPLAHLLLLHGAGYGVDGARQGLRMIRRHALHGNNHGHNPDSHRSGPQSGENNACSAQKLIFQRRPELIRHLSTHAIILSRPYRRVLSVRSINARCRACHSLTFILARSLSMCAALRAFSRCFHSRIILSL